MAENLVGENQKELNICQKQAQEDLTLLIPHYSTSILAQKSANVIDVPKKHLAQLPKGDQMTKQPYFPEKKLDIQMADFLKPYQQQSPAKRRHTLYTLSYEKDAKEEKEDDSKENSRKSRKLTMITNQKDSQSLKNISFGKDYHYLKKRPPPINLARITKEQHLLRFSQQDYAGNILQPSKKMLQNQKDLNQAILHIKQAKSRALFLLSGIPLGSRLTIEVIIEKDSIFRREYSFWLAGQQGKVLLMHSNKNLKLLEDYYVINEYVENMNCYSFLAKLQSNLLRKQFILSNETDYNEDPNRQIFADINVYPSANGQNAYALYFPMFGKVCNRQTIVKGYRDPNILKQLASHNDYIDYLAPCQLLPGAVHHFMKQEGLIPTKKSISLMDRQGWLKLYTGKVESNRYRMYVGSGVSPLIAFATFMVLYES